MTGHDTPTLGERLDAAARAIAGRHQMRYQWADSMIPMLRRVARLAESPGDRFERHEAPVGPQPPVSAAEAERARWPAPPEAAGHARRPAQPAAPPPRHDGEVSSPADDLPTDVRAALTDVAGPGAGLLRVRTGAAADSLSRANRAEAVTTGTDVWFRAGRFRPREPEGLALLAHEAAHVTALLDPDRARRRAAAGGVGQEEDAALAAETAALRRFGQTPAGPVTMARPVPGSPAAVPRAQPHPPPGSADLAGSSATATTTAAAARPMPASADREISPPPAFDVDELRRSLLADLMRQLRSDFERGG
jgi:hypothetical protein